MQSTRNCVDFVRCWLTSAYRLRQSISDQVHIVTSRLYQKLIIVNTLSIQWRYTCMYRIHVYIVYSKCISYIVNREILKFIHWINIDVFTVDITTLKISFISSINWTKYISCQRTSVYEKKIFKLVSEWKLHLSKIKDTWIYMHKSLWNLQQFFSLLSVFRWY